MKFDIRATLMGLLSFFLQPLTWCLPRTGADLTSLIEILKAVYDPVIQDQQNTSAVTWNEFADGDDPIGGTGWTFDARMGGNQQGIGSRVEKGTLPSAGNQIHKQGIIVWKLLYGTFELSGPVMEAARSNVYAFAVAKTDEIQGLTRDLLKDWNRQIMGDGTGVLATSNAVDPGANQFQITDGLYLRLNMLFDMWRPSTSTNLFTTSRKITVLTPNADGTMTVTYDGADVAYTQTVGDVMVRAGDTTYVATAAVSSEMTGLQQIVAESGTFQNISRTTYPIFKGQVLDNATVKRNLSLDLMQQAEDAIVRSAGKRPNWVRSNLGQRRKFFDLVAPDKRYMTGRIDGGFERLEYNGLEITIDVDAPKSQIFFLTKESIKKYTLRKFGILDHDGQAMLRTSNQDNYVGYLAMYGNLGCKQPNCNVRLTDLQEPVEEQWVA